MINKDDLNSKENREAFDLLLTKAVQAGKSLEEYVKDFPLSNEEKEAIIEYRKKLEEREVAMTQLVAKNKLNSGQEQNKGSPQKLEQIQAHPSPLENKISPRDRDTVLEDGAILEPNQKRKTCPLCGTSGLKRIRRIGQHRILRFIPFAKLYECPDCYKVSLFILGHRTKEYRK